MCVRACMRACVCAYVCMCVPLSLVGQTICQIYHEQVCESVKSGDGSAD